MENCFADSASMMKLKLAFHVETRVAHFLRGHHSKIALMLNEIAVLFAKFSKDFQKSRH